MIMKLISMVDFVLAQNEIETVSDYIVQRNRARKFSKILNYALFLKQPLRLGMFVPCDEEGNVLKETPPFQYYGEHTSDTAKRVWGYKEAQEKVLFKDFKITKKENFYFIEKPDNIKYFRLLNNSNKTIEDLLTYDKSIELTESAITQLSL